MKKIIVTLFLILLMIIITGCASVVGNRQFADTTIRFDRVIIKLLNGDVVDGPVQSWLDWENGDSIQVKVNGVTYYTHLSNVVLIDN